MKTQQMTNDEMTKSRALRIFRLTISDPFFFPLSLHSILHTTLVFPLQNVSVLRLAGRPDEFPGVSDHGVFMVM